MRRFLLPFVVTVSIAGTIPVSGDQTDVRLPPLFQQLREAPSALAAREVEEKIWRIWSETGDPKQDNAFDLGSQALALGDYKTALIVFLDMTRTAPDFAEGWNKLATVEYLMGDYHSSLRSIDRTLALEPRHFGALSGLGLVNMELEREEAALDAFERVIAIYPQSQSAIANAEYVRKTIKDKEI